LLATNVVKTAELAPIPPATTNAPLVFEVEGVVLLTYSTEEPLTVINDPVLASALFAVMNAALA
jgi:hypothetical protein